MEEQNCWLGRGVYAHYLDSEAAAQAKASAKPYIIFSTEIGGNVKLNVMGANGVNFAKITTGGVDWNPINLIVKILESGNLKGTEQ